MQHSSLHTTTLIVMLIICPAFATNTEERKKKKISDALQWDTHFTWGKECDIALNEWMKHDEFLLEIYTFLLLLLLPLLPASYQLSTALKKKIWEQSDETQCYTENKNKFLHFLFLFFSLFLQCCRRWWKVRVWFTLSVNTLVKERFSVRKKKKSFLFDFMWWNWYVLGKEKINISMWRMQ